MRALILVGMVVSLLASASGFPARGLEKKGGWCETGKSRAAGSYARCRLIEMGRALRFGTVPVLARCERRFSKRWTEIGARRGRSCVASGGREAVQAVLDAAAGQVAALIGGVSPAPTAAATATVAATGTATGTAAAAPVTPTRTATATETRTPTATATLTVTQTSPPTPTLTPTAVPPTAAPSGTATATVTSAPSPHLLVSEIAVSPTGAEFIEIHNPAAGPVDLSAVYLADYKSYYLITTGGGAPLSSDFRLRFPPGTVIGAAGYLVVSLESASTFQSAYGIPPDFDLDAGDAGAPAMLGSFKGPSGLTDSHEMVVLFRWDGASDLVEDLDYVVYGDSSQAMDKTGVVVGTSAYAADTDPSLQDYASAPGSGSSLCRIDATEGTETAASGNGITGHDETSENLATTFAIQTPPSPGGPCT